MVATLRGLAGLGVKVERMTVGEGKTATVCVGKEGKTGGGRHPANNCISSKRKKQDRKLNTIGSYLGIASPDMQRIIGFGAYHPVIRCISGDT
jgi:hypothetical protein